MRRSKLRSQLLLLTLAALLIAALFGGGAFWVLAQDIAGPGVESAWIGGLCAAAAIVAPLLLSLAVARPMSAAMISQAAIAKAIVAGTPPPVPADVPVAE